MKKLIAALIIVSLVCSSTLTVTNATPENDASKVRLVEVSDKLKNLNAELTNTNNEINDLQTAISNNQASIEDHQKKIENAEAKISDLKDEISENENILSKRLREMYKNNGFTAVNYISFLFESTSLSDLIDRVTACNVIINEDNKLINNLNKKVNEQNKQKDLISSKKSELESLNDDTKKKLSEVNDKKNSQVEIKQQLEAEQARLTETITKNETALIQNDINTINNSSNPDEIRKAINNIEAIIPQLTIQSVKDNANECIKKGQDKLANMPVNSTSTSKENPSSQSSFKNPPGSGAVSATYTMEATAYTGDGITATGLKPVRNPSGLSTVAVDPNVIPLGSKVYVEGYGYALASDTGGDIKGMRIDVFMNSKDDCTKWGRKTVTVSVLA